MKEDILWELKPCEDCKWNEGRNLNSDDNWPCESCRIDNFEKKPERIKEKGEM